MKTLLRIAYFALLYGLLAFTSRADEVANRIGAPGPVIEYASVPESGAIGLISLLVVLLALQRPRSA